MFSNLSDKLDKAFHVLKGHGKITEINVAETLKEVRRALLDADVNFKIAKDFTAKVKDKAMGQDVLTTLQPGQLLVKLVKDELTELMGGDVAGINLSGTPTVILMSGLQGSGKTTFSGKLANYLQTKKGKKPLLVACDIYRPAAIQQLYVVGDSIGVEVYSEPENKNPVEIAQNAIQHAKANGFNVVIVDTAGRLAVDEEMMNEIERVHKAIQPQETLFVVDSMTGQDAVNTAKAFGDALPLTGVILTKLDSDTRGGAALSVRQVTGKPIKYIGTSEKINGLEPFHPERMASRILGMGDIVSLVEDAQKTLDVKEAEKLAEKVKSGKNFDLEDFKNQIGQMKKMGGVGALMDKMPAQFTSAASKINPEDGDKSLRQIEAIISSMTPLERRKPELIKATRKKRIALGSGVQVQDVNRVLNQFEEMQKMMKMFSKGGLGKLMRGMAGKIPGLRP